MFSIKMIFYIEEFRSLVGAKVTLVNLLINFRYIFTTFFFKSLPFKSLFQGGNEVGKCKVFCLERYHLTVPRQTEDRPEDGQLLLVSNEWQYLRQHGHHQLQHRVPVTVIPDNHHLSLECVQDKVMASTIAGPDDVSELVQHLPGHILL